MVVEFGTRPDLRDARSRSGAMLTSQSDFTGKTVLFGLPVGTDIHYRETAVDHG
jgi:alkaline phosphatase D